MAKNRPSPEWLVIVLNRTRTSGLSHGGFLTHSDIRDDPEAS
jgi:hypothetical protein